MSDVCSGVFLINHQPFHSSLSVMIEDNNLSSSSPQTQLQNKLILHLFHAKRPTGHFFSDQLVDLKENI